MTEPTSIDNLCLKKAVLRRFLSAYFFGGFFINLEIYIF